MTRNRILGGLLLAALLGGGGRAAAHEAVPPLHPGVPLVVLLQEIALQERGWLGVSFDEAAPAAGGLRVLAVHPRSPAERAGVRRGDVVLRMNGRALTPATLRELSLQPGDTVRVRLNREGREQELALVAARRPEQVVTIRTVPGEVTIMNADSTRRVFRVHTDSLRRVLRIHADSARVRIDTLAIHADSLHRRLRVMLADSLGPQFRVLERELRGNVRVQALADSLVRQGRVVTALVESELGARSVAGAEFTELNPALAEYFRGAQNGLVVLRVAPETPAARAGLEPGDVVTRANGSAITSIRQLRAAVAEAPNRAVTLDIVRRGRAQQLSLRWER